MSHQRMRRATLSLAGLLLLLAVARTATQAPPLTVVSANPAGELRTLADARQIRVTFSESMVAIGAPPQSSAPAWISITPPVSGAFYWAGTRTLIFSPDVEHPLPFATTFTVRVDTSATSASGRRLETPFELTFRTPGVRMVQARHHRIENHVERPVLIALEFNARVAADEVLRHLRVALEPHAWQAPALTAEARSYLASADPDGLAQFDRKVDGVRRIAASRERIDVHLAAPERFVSMLDRYTLEEKRHRLVLLETDLPPPPGGQIRVTLDQAFPSVSHLDADRTATFALEPAFFALALNCERECHPGSPPAVRFSSGVINAQALRSALTLTDVTTPGEEHHVEAFAIDRNYGERVDLQWTDSEPRGMRRWRVRVAPDLRSHDGQTLGYSWVAFSDTIHAMPLLELGGWVVEAGDPPIVPVLTRNVTAVTQQISRVPLSSLARTFGSLDLSRTARTPPPSAPGAPETRRLDISPDRTLVQTLHVSSVLAGRSTGLVWASIESGGVIPRSFARPDLPFEAHLRSAIVQVTNLGVTLKRGAEGSLAFVTRLDTGAPVPAARVSVFDLKGHLHWNGTTGTDGVVRISPSTRFTGETWGTTSIVIAEKDRDVAFVSSNWRNATFDIRDYFDLYDFDLYDASPPSGVRGSVFTDRSFYRQGETVHVKLVLRKSSAGTLRPLAAGDVVTAIVSGPHGEVSRRRLRVNEWSSAEWSWPLPETAALGHYRIEAYHGDAPRESSEDSDVRAEFDVVAMRIPAARVDVTLSAQINGQTPELTGHVRARFLSGHALGARPFHWWMGRRAARKIPSVLETQFSPRNWAIGYEASAYGNDEANATLTGEGDADVRLNGASVDFAVEYTLEADVDVLAGQRMSARHSVIVYPSSIYVALAKPNAAVDARDGFTTSIAVSDLEGRAVPDTPVTVSLVREQRVRNDPTTAGESYEPWKTEEIPSGEWHLRSTSTATPIAIAVPGGGSYILRATARDASGRPTRTEARFYAVGSRAEVAVGTDTGLELTPERETWAPGERARILVRSPWSAATALVTTERNGVRAHQVVAMSTPTQFVEVPITKADVPNVFVSVLLIKGRTSRVLAADGSDSGRPDYQIAHTALKVEDPSAQLRVHVSSDNQEYAPGSRARVTVQVTSVDGAPVRGEVTLWAVDAGILALGNSWLPNLHAVLHPQESRNVVTNDNRMRMLVTRLQAIQAGVDGSTATKLAGAVLSGGDVVSVSARQTVALMSAGPEPLRREFRPVPFWIGSLRTDARGRVSTTVTLPDSLTAFRIRAVATDVSRFGAGEHEIRVTKPLMLQPSFPRFLTRGDMASLAVNVASVSAGDVNVALDIQTPGVLEAAGPVTRSVRMTVGMAQTVTFDVRAIAAGTATVRVRAAGTGVTDAIELPVKVVVPTLAVTTSAFGETSDQSHERLTLPTALSPDDKLRITLASTAVPGLSGAAVALADYQYDCAEQKASRALAFLTVARSDGLISIPGVSASQATTRAADLLKSLLSHQCYEGGFSLWGDDCNSTSVYLTSHVLHVLRAAGRPVLLPPAAVDEALTYLAENGVDAPASAWAWGSWAISRAYAAKTLAEFGRSPAADLDRLLPAIDRLPLAGLSYVADALAASGDRGPRYQKVIGRLLNALRVNGSLAYVEDRGDTDIGWVWQSSVTATAVVLEGLVRRQDRSPLASSLARWLVSTRTDGRWQSTHEDALALEALMTYYRATEPASRMRGTVRAGNAILADAQLGAVGSRLRSVNVPLSGLAGSSESGVPLTFSRTGTGTLFYSAQLRTTVDMPADAADRGILVERRYEQYQSGTTPVDTARPFRVGDVVRVTVTATLRAEGRYVALTDLLPAGFEAIDGQFDITARTLAEQATSVEYAGDEEPEGFEPWSGFDHVEKRDDRVLAFATFLAPGRHRFSYLVRITTAGTFTAPGASMELMYAPDVSGRSAAATVNVAP